MNKVLTLLFSFIMCSTVLAQSALPEVPPIRSFDDEHDVGPYFYGGYSYGMMRVKEFKTFAASYNSFYGPGGQNILDSDLESFRSCRGYIFGGGIHIGPMILGVSTAHLVSTTEVDIKGGNKRVFTHVMRIPAKMDIGFGNKYISGTFSTGFGSPYLMVGYQYNDGPISYGGERSLNGIFKSTCITYGVNIAGKIPFAKIFALTIGFSFDAYRGFEYEDVNWNKIFWLGSPSYSQYMPTDVAEFSNSPSAYPLEKAMKSRGYNLYVYGGLTLQLF